MFQTWVTDGKLLGVFDLNMLIWITLILALLAAVLLAATVLLFIRSNRKLRYQEWRELHAKGKPMQSKKERENQVKAVIADIITAGFLEASVLPPTHEAYLSPEETRYWSRLLGNVLSIKDLVPRNTDILKDQIRKRLKNYKPPKMVIPPEIAATSPSGKATASEKETPVTSIPIDITARLKRRSVPQQLS